MNFVNLNGKLFKANEPIFLASNRSYRYGDGLFETLKVVDGVIPFSVYHFERLLNSCLLLQFNLPTLLTVEVLQQQILDLCKKNNCIHLGRVRLSLFRGNGGLYDGDKTTQYVLEAWPLSKSLCQWNVNGLVTDIYMDARKACDTFSHLKSSSCIAYNVAAQYAKAHQLNDCFVLNSKGNIADSTIANVFILKADEVITPPLSEGCVDGVMRRHVIHTLLQNGYQVKQKPITIDFLKSADEVFVTNAIKGLQWVGQCGDVRYPYHEIEKIYHQFFKL